MKFFLLGACFVSAIGFTLSIARGDEAPEPADPIDLSLSQETQNGLDKTLAGPARTVPSLVVVMTAGEDIVYRFKSGANNDTQFAIGSVTKQMTAAAILKLEDQRRVDLDDRLSNYLPDFPHADQIRLRQLLNHSSGLPDYVEIFGFGQGQPDLELKELVAKLAVTLKDFPLRFEPGDRFDYSNTNYIILGSVIEKVAGKPYEEFLGDTVLAPLRRHKISYIEPKGKSAKPELPPNTLPANFTYAGPAGGYWSSAEDLARWNMYLYNGEILDNTDTFFLRNREGDRTAIDAPMPLSRRGIRYAFGTYVDERGRYPVFFHDGRILGYNSFVATWMLPDDAVSVTILTNATEVNNVAGLATQLLMQVIPEIRLRRWIDRLEEGDVDEDQLTPELRRMMTDEAIDAAEDEFSQAGDIQSVTRRDVTDFVVTHKNRQYAWRISLDKSLTIKALAYQRTR